VTQDLNAKLQQQMDAVSNTMDAMLKKFNASAESMLAKSSQQKSAAYDTAYDAMCTENARLKNEVVGLQELIIELYQWSLKPDLVAPVNLEVWTKVVSLVTYWKHVQERKTEEQQGADNAA
jgi:hypothetical protein